MSARRWIAGTIAALALTVGCSSGTPSGSDETGTVRLAATNLQGLEELQREFGAFKDEFEKQSGLNLEFFAVNDRTAAAAALQADRVDIVLTGPAEYVVIHERTNARPIVAMQQDGYRSVIYTRADSGITNLEQLRGQKIAMTDVGSTSGHLGPSQMLVDAGLTPGTDVEVLTVGDATHAALKRGDVAAVGINYHDYEEYTSEEDPAQFPLLAEGPNFPPDVLMAREGLDEQTITTIRDTFTNHFDTLLPALMEGKGNARYENATVVDVEDEDYDPIRMMYRAIGVTDFSQFVGN